MKLQVSCHLAVSIKGSEAGTARGTNPRKLVSRHHTVLGCPVNGTAAVTSNGIQTSNSHASVEVSDIEVDTDV